MKLPRLKNYQSIPWGGGYRITDPATGVSSFALQFLPLLEKVKQTRMANGVPIGIGFQDEIETLCCQNYPAECQETDPDFPTIKGFTLNDVVNGSRVMMAFKLAGSPLVERAEAERRAKICIGCSFNQSFAKPCVGICAELQSVVNSVVSHVGTQYDAQLNACGICHCLLQAAIHLPLEIQCKGVTDQMKRQFKNVQPACWKTCE